jgi:tagatose-6-phosphate ketose/aldose isomerase
MQECRLKILEMTAGRIASNADTYLGLRHGPQVFVNEECGVVASVSTDESRSRYELDLLRELQSKGQGRATLSICDRKTPEIEALGGTVIELNPDARSLPDELRVVTDVVVGQLIGLFKSMELSLKPDNPSEGGIINRVVTGVRVYPLVR